jgi:hypothetical protein
MKILLSLLFITSAFAANATVDVNMTKSDLSGVYTETIKAPRFTGGTGTTPGIFLGFFSYPIELPNFSTTTIKTTVSVPVGGTKVVVDKEKTEPKDNKKKPLPMGLDTPE